MVKKFREQAKPKSLDQKIQEAAKEVARVVPGDPASVESELVKRLMEPDTEPKKGSDLK